MTRLVAIHQPNFFPWLGYFDKIRRADVFVFLDDVQFPKTGGTWTNRVQLLHAGAACWWTAPIDRSFHGVRAIHEMSFATHTDWRTEVLAKLASCYRQAPFYAEVLQVVEPLVRSEHANIAAFNMQSIVRLMDLLGLGDKTWLRSSSIPIKTASTQRLVDITRQVGGTHYLSGGGAANYQDESLFAEAGLQLVHQRFAHPRYPQGVPPAFVAGLSIIDALMHCGIGATAEMIQNKRAPALHGVA